MNDTDGTVLIKDLSHVPEIVAGLGLSIAAAQSALNKAYLDGLERVLGMCKSLHADPGLEGKADQREFVATLIKQLAPAQYQFTETTLSVRLNLAQSMDKSSEVGLGVGFGAVAVNAAFAVAYGYDYEAAAECRTVLHARPLDPNVLERLLARSTELSNKALELPAQHQHEKAVLEQAEKIFTLVANKEKPDAKMKIPAAADKPDANKPK
jgi:hypothetical protein